MRKFWIIIITISVIAIVAVVVFVASVYYGAFGHLQTRQELMNYKNATASVVLSRNEELIGKFFSENRTNIDFDEIPDHLLNALIATEDIRFYKHRGFDIKSFFRVLVKTIMLNNRNAGGGSTITQQLAKNMYGRDNYGLLTILVNKTKEIILAGRIEKVLSKEEIITLYLNTVSFGENVYGVEAAARRFFNKKVDELKVEESAVLIGLLKANNYYNPRLYPENAKKRRNVVLGQMKKYNYLDPHEADSLIALPLIHNYVNFEAGGPADYFLYQVKYHARDILQEVKAKTGKEWNIEEDGLVITTTLDLNLQNYANKAFKDHLGVMQKRLNQQYQTVSGKRAAARIADHELKRLHMMERADQTSFQDFSRDDSTFTGAITVRDSMIQAVRILQAGLMAMDPGTGDIMAWVGGIDFKTQPYDQILARRQLASTFKPFLYTVALEEGFSPCDYLDNDSITDSGIEGWSPENFDHTTGGKFSLAGALVHSMNIPTFNLYRNISFDDLDTLWTRMGFYYTLHDYPSVAMGTAEASVMEVAIAYSTFANGGFKIETNTIQSIKTSDGEIIWEKPQPKKGIRIISDNTTRLLGAILRRAVLEGTGSALGGIYGVTIPLSGKTGTSQDYADAWFSAFNPSLVIVSRVGASSPSIHFYSGSNGSGSALALPLVGLTLKQAQLNPDLKKRFTTYLPGLPEDMQYALDCPDYREETFFEKVLERFKGGAERQPVDKSLRDNRKTEESPKKKSFFKRLFERKR
jgi:penicillin-binding protein 1A